MFISKKKHEKQVWDAKLKAFESQAQQEQEDKLWKLEAEVKKLKKKMRKLEGIVKNGY